MKYSQMTALALAELVGERIKQYRLNSNKTQEELAEITGISRQKIVRAESGKGTLETYMGLLLGLEATDNLDALLPPVPISPVQLAKLKGRGRVRASSKSTNKSSKSNDEEDLGW